jgi:hypothetical protein
MYNYQFKNLNVKHEGQDYLCHGLAKYEIDDYEEDGRQAGFESAEVYDALGKDGFVTDKAFLAAMENSVLFVLNNDNYLCRLLGNKL